MPEQSVSIPVPSKDPKKKKEEENGATSDGKASTAKPNGDAKEGEELVRAFHVCAGTIRSCSYNVIVGGRPAAQERA
jgi:hypothetical protein